MDYCIDLIDVINKKMDNYSREINKYFIDIENEIDDCLYD